MKEDILRYKKEFTLYEIALIWAGVEVETTGNRENVRSALRILLRALENLKLLSDWRIKQPDLDPKDLRDETGDYNFNGPWTRYLVTLQDLREMFHRLGDPLPAWLDSEAEPLDSPCNKKGRYSQETLLRIIGGLIMLLVNRSNNSKKYLKGNKINKSVIREDIEQMLQNEKVSLRGLSQSHFLQILQEVTTEEFYEELSKVLNDK